MAKTVDEHIRLQMAELIIALARQNAEIEALKEQLARLTEVKP